MEDNLQGQFRGAFFGAAIGDALGFITEFMNKSSDIHDKYHVDKLTKLIGWERPTKYYYKNKSYTIRLPLSAGTYSDDTQLTLATTRSLNIDGSFNPNTFSKFELPLWLNYELGGGSGTKAAARNLLRADTHWHNNFYTTKYSTYTKSGGNGAAMRILPIALVNADNSTKRYFDVWKNSITTHGHPRGILGAILFADSISILLKKPRDKKEWLHQLVELSTRVYPDLLSKWSNSSDFTEFNFAEWKENWRKIDGNTFDSNWISTCQEVFKGLKLVQECFEKKPPIKSILAELGCYNPATKGAGTNTVIAAILYLCQTISPSKSEHNFEEIIVSVINEIGIDTDTIGYFTGAMLGAYYGEQLIPHHFKDNIQDSEYITMLADWCYQVYKKDERVAPLIQYPASPGGYEIQKLPSYLKTDIEIGASINIPILGGGKVLFDRDITPYWENQHIHFLAVNLSIGQRIHFKVERKVVSAIKTYGEEQPQFTSPTDKASAVTSQLVALDKFKDQLEQSSFEPEVLISILVEIKFIRKDKSLYNAFTTWLWSALPEEINL